MTLQVIECIMLGIITIVSLIDLYFIVVNNQKHIKKVLAKVKRRPKRRLRKQKPPLKLIAGGTNE